MSVVPDQYFVCEGHGYLTLGRSRDVQTELDDLAALHPRIDQVLYDGTGVDGFEPGIAIRWINWAKSRPRPSRRVAIVTRLTTIAGVAATLRFMLPRLRFAVFGSRRAAVAFLESANEVPPSGARR